MVLPNESHTGVETQGHNSANPFQQAIENMVAPGPEVVPPQVMPEGILREHTQVGGNLSDLTIQTLSDSLASELEFIIALQKKTPKPTLEPWMKVLFNQAITSLGKAEGEPLGYEDLFSVANENLRSGDPTVSRIWEEIGDRVVKQQLARIEVLTEGELNLTNPTDLPTYQERQSNIASVGEHGVIHSPEYNGPQGGRLKRWWNNKRDNVKNTDIEIDTFDKRNPRSWLPPFRRLVKHKFFNGITPQFGAEAVIDYSRTLDGDTEHKAAEWMKMQPELRRGTGSPVGDFDKQRLADRMLHMAAAISEVSDRRHDEPLSQNEDFIFSKQKKDDNGQPIPDQYETTGRGRDKVQLHIEGLEDPFPVDFSTMKPEEQLNTLTNILDQKAQKELEKINRSKFIAGPIRQHIAQAEGALATSADPKRFEAKIAEHDEALRILRLQDGALGGYIEAGTDVDKKSKAFTELGDQKTEYTTILDALKTDHDTFRNNSTAKSKKEIEIREIRDLTNELKALQAKKGQKSAPSNLDTQIQEKTSELTGRGTAKIATLDSEIIDCEAEIDRVKGQEAQYQEVQRQINEIGNLMKDATFQKGMAGKNKTAKEEELYKVYSLGTVPTDPIELAGFNAAKADLIKNASKHKSQINEEITQRLSAQSELRERANKQDAGIVWRLDRLKACQEILLDDVKYGAIEQRIEQGVINSVHGAASHLRSAHDAMPNLPPAYLHAIYVFAGRGALEQTPEGKVLFKKASKLLTPVDFYHQLLSKPARIRRLLTVLGTHPPESIYDERFTKDPKVMDEVMGMMDSAFLEELVDFSLYSAQGGYDSDPDREFAKAVGEVQGGLDAGTIPENLKREQQDEEMARVGLSLDVVRKIHGTTIEIAAVADAHNIDHDTALKIAGILKTTMDQQNVMIAADIPGAVPALVLAIDAFPAVDKDGGPLDRDSLVEAVAEKLIYHPATGSDFIMQAEALDNALERYHKSGALMESLNRIFPPTPDVEKKLLVLSSLLPSVDVGILQTLSAELSRAVAQRRIPDMGVIFGIPQGDIIRNKFERRLKEIVAIHNRKTGQALVDISTLTPLQVANLASAADEQYGLPADRSESLLESFITDGQRTDMVRFYDTTLAHLTGAELALEIQADTQFDRHEAMVITHFILEKRKLQTIAVPVQGYREQPQAPVSAEANEDVENDDGNE